MSEIWLGVELRSGETAVDLTKRIVGHRLECAQEESIRLNNELGKHNRNFLGRFLPWTKQKGLLFALDESHKEVSKYVRIEARMERGDYGLAIDLFKEEKQIYQDRSNTLRSFPFGTHHGWMMMSVGGTINRLNLLIGHLSRSDQYPKTDVA